MTDSETLALLRQIAATLDGIRADMRKQHSELEDQINSRVVALAEVIAAGFGDLTDND